MDDYITPLEEPLIQTPEYHRARAVRKCQVVTFVVVLLGIITLGIGLAIPERRFNHGTRLLRATHVINATHVMHMPLDDNASHLVLHDESSPQVMHLPTTHNGTSEQVLFAGSSQHDPRQALLRSKYRGHKLKASSKPWLGRNNPENEDVSLPTVLAYARMASSAYDYIKNTYDGSTGDIARGKGDGYGHATNEGLSHVKAVVYESGEYSCWWWCRFVPDIKSTTKHTANVVVAFKGTTEIGWTMRSDFLTDADMFIYSVATNDTIRLAAENGPHIKRYWLESEAIVETVKRLFPPSPTTILQLSFTGHSLGGVLAGLHAIKNNVLGFGFNSPPGTRVAEILGVDLTGGLGDALGADSNTSNPYSRSSFCTYNTVSDILSNQSPPDVIPILMSNMGGLDLVFLGAQAQRAAAFLRSGAYRPQHQFGRVAPIITAPTLKDPIELHSIVTIVQLLEAFKNGKGQGSDLRCA